MEEEGFLGVTGRKKELIITAGGKNVAPAVLEDRLRAHPLISQCIVVGDARPYVACLITLDPEPLEFWKKQHGRPAGATPAELRDDPDLIAEIQLSARQIRRRAPRSGSRGPGSGRAPHRSRRPPPAGPTQTLPGRRSRAPRRPGRPAGSGTAWRTRSRRHNGPAARPAEPPR